MPKQFTVALVLGEEHLLELVRTAKGEKVVIGRGKGRREERIGDVYDLLWGDERIGEIRREAKPAGIGAGAHLRPVWSGIASIPGIDLQVEADTCEAAAGSILAARMQVARRG